MPLFYFIITAVANQFSAQVQAELFKYLFNDCCSVWYHCKILVLLCTFSKVIVFKWDFSKQSDNKEIIMELHLVIHLILKEVKNIYCYAKINFSLQLDFFFFPQRQLLNPYTPFLLPCNLIYGLYFHSCTDITIFMDLSSISIPSNFLSVVANSRKTWKQTEQKKLFNK